MNRLNHAIQGPAMKRLTSLFLILMLGGCQTIGMHEDLAPNLPSIDSSLRDTQTPESTSATPPEVAAALLPPVQLALPETIRPSEPRFDVAVNHVAAQEFFMGLVDGTRYNMVVHPEVGGDISLTLKNVTVNEVMQTINSVYGYEYRKNGTVYEVLPARLRSKVFKVDYLNMRRVGTSQTRVSSGQISQSSSGGSSNGVSGNNTNSSSSNSGSSGNSSSSSNDVVSGTEVNTKSEADFWLDLKSTLELLIGTEGDNRVVVNPQAGLVVIRAMPGDIREAEEYLSTLQNAVQRQVILEAKIIEVELNDGFQSGINWAALGEP
ncbi:MAG: secretin N-terminal domain-containing protein, partial [Gammaproteobacteria bacterium]|nr:secretin N-terminal domain-containing protein [Gammaproteobacteria bacterium]